MTLPLYNCQLLDYYFNIPENIKSMTNNPDNKIKHQINVDPSLGNVRTDGAFESTILNQAKSRKRKIANGNPSNLSPKQDNGPKFPYHHYLRQHYNRLSLQEQISIFQWYFNYSQKSDKEITLQTSHIQILNEGLNQFTKLPEEPLLFILIQQYNQTKQILIIKNSEGEVFHFQILDNNKKRCTIIGQVKRKLRGRGFIIINDKSKLSQVIKKSTINKIETHSKYLYIRSIKNRRQYDNLKNQFFANNMQRTQRNFQSIILQNGRIAIIRLTDEKFYTYCDQTNKDLNIQGLSLIINYYTSIFQKLVLQENQLIFNDTRASQINVRLRIFDFLYINYLKFFHKTNQDKQQFVKTVSNMGKKLAINVDENPDNQDHHFPQKIFNSRRCKCCEILERGKNKKSKFKCIGCSIKFQTDLPLCIDCFNDFHEEILPHCGKASLKRLKKSYQSYLSKRNSQRIVMQEPNKEFEKSIENNEQVREAILKLNENMNQIQKLMGQLQEHSFLGAKIVKQLNQAMFINIINSFNCVLENDIQSQLFKQNVLTPNQIQGVFNPSNPSNVYQNA